jgi:hypothetical protein
VYVANAHLHKKEWVCISIPHIIYIYIRISLRFLPIDSTITFYLCIIWIRQHFTFITFQLILNIFFCIFQWQGKITANQGIYMLRLYFCKGQVSASPLHVFVYAVVGNFDARWEPFKMYFIPLNIIPTCLVIHQHFTWTMWSILEMTLK